MIRLSKRLQAVADRMQSGGVAADIGCDHAFVAIYLVSAGKASAAIAMDVKPGPLERAAAHIKEAGLGDRISLRLSDGMDKLEAGEADTIIISGMGGALMEQILRAKQNVLQSAEELVLSPQSEIYKVRHCLHELGFRIAMESMVKDKGKYYVIMRAVPGSEHYSDPIEYTYGKCLMESDDPVFWEYMKREENRVCGILERFPQKENPEEWDRLEDEYHTILAVQVSRVVKIIPHRRKDKGQ